MQSNPQTAREGLKDKIEVLLRDYLKDNLDNWHTAPTPELIEEYLRFHMPGYTREAFAKLFDQYVADEVRQARVNTAEILKTKSGWYSQLGHDGLEDTLVPVSEIDKYIAHLTRSPDQTEGGSV